MEDEEFQKKYGTLYEGLCLDMEDSKRRTALLFPVFFVIRRLLFVASAIWLDGFIWSQIAIQFFVSVWMIIYLFHYWPFENRIFTILEVVNEVTTVLLLYHMLCYTDFVPDPWTRYIMGWSFILVTCGNLIIHVTLLARNSLVNLKNKFVEKCSRKKETEKEEEKQEEEVDSDNDSVSSMNATGSSNFFNLHKYRSQNPVSVSIDKWDIS